MLPLRPHDQQGDVYKRQREERAITENKEIFSKEEVAVSYTHLDVYKRQHFDIPDEVYAELRRKARAEVAVSRKGAQIESVQAQMFGGDTGWQSSSQNGAI